MMNTLKELYNLFSYSPVKLWDYNIVVSSTYFNPSILKIDKTSIVISNFCYDYYGYNAIYPPFTIGDVTEVDIEQTLCKLEELNNHKLGGIFSVPEDIIKKIDESKFIVDEHYPEYIYDVNEQLDLTGAKFKKTRNMIKHFKKFRYEIQELSFEEHIEKIMELSQEKPMLEQVLYKAVRKYKDFTKIDKSLFGFVVFIQDKIVGLSINTMNGDTFYSIIRRVDKHIGGVTEFMNYYALKMYKNKNPNLKWFNDGDAGDIQGLISYKEKMNPIKKNRVFEIYDKNNPLE